MGNLQSCISAHKDEESRPLTINDFVLIRTIGKGSFGKVSLAFRKGDESEEMLGIKTIEKTVLLNSVAEFRTIWIERNMMTLFSSPFVMNIIHAFQDKQKCYMVMPFMPGGDMRYFIRHVLRGHPMPEDALKFYAAEIILALEHIHSFQVVYRDLKPENIMIGPEGHLCITDFGLSDRLRHSRRAGQLAGRSGTKPYMAPEQLRRIPYRFSVDFFALGVTLTELRCGRRPFSPDDIMVEDIPPRFKDEPSELCKDFLEQLLEKNPEHRLGCGKFGWQEVKNHRFFSGFDWEACARQEYEPPHKPKMKRLNTDIPDDPDSVFYNTAPPTTIPVAAQEKFKRFEYRAVLTVESEAQKLARQKKWQDHEMSVTISRFIPEEQLQSPVQPMSPIVQASDEPVKRRQSDSGQALYSLNDLQQDMQQVGQKLVIKSRTGEPLLEEHSPNQGSRDEEGRGSRDEEGREPTSPREPARQIDQDDVNVDGMVTVADTTKEIEDRQGDQGESDQGEKSANLRL